jgi:hypothetical protein
MKKQITRVSVVQSGKVMAGIYLLLSLPIALVLAIPGLLGVPDFPAGVALVFPVLYALVAFIGTAFFAWIYNVVATRLGGIEFVTAEVNS